MAKWKIDVEIPRGVDLERVEATIREALAAAAAEQATVERRSQGLADPFTLATIGLGGGFLGGVARDVWRRYIRPALDARFGPTAIKERTAARKQMRARKTTPKKKAARRPAGKRKAPVRKASGRGGIR